MSFLARAPIVINSYCSRRGTLICRGAATPDLCRQPSRRSALGSRVTLWLKRIAAPAVDDAYAPLPTQGEAIRADVDGLVHHCHLVTIRGNSYRLRQHTELWQTLHAPQDPEPAADATRVRDPAARLHHLSTFLGHVSPDTTAVCLTITSDLLAEANRRFEALAVPMIAEVRP